MVHLYACTLCKKEIPADDNRIQCVDCGSEICGKCYLRKKTSHYHSLTHENYIMAEFSGSMYIRPPAPPMLAALKENKPAKRAKPAAAPQKRPRIVKREQGKKGHANRPAAAPRTHPASRKLKCATCRKHHQACTGPRGDDGWCERCLRSKYPTCDFDKAELDAMSREASSSGLSSLSSSQPAFESKESTQPTFSLSSHGRSESPSTSRDRESSLSNSPDSVTRGRLLSRRERRSAILDEQII